MRPAREKHQLLVSDRLLERARGWADEMITDTRNHGFTREFATVDTALKCETKPAWLNAFVSHQIYKLTVHRFRVLHVRYIDHLAAEAMRHEARAKSVRARREALVRGIPPCSFFVAAFTAVWLVFPAT